MARGNRRVITKSVGRRGVLLALLVSGLLTAQFAVSLSDASGGATTKRCRIGIEDWNLNAFSFPETMDESLWTSLYNDTDVMPETVSKQLIDDRQSCFATSRKKIVNLYDEPVIFQFSIGLPESLEIDDIALLAIGDDLLIVDAIQSEFYNVTARRFVYRTNLDPGQDIFIIVAAWVPLDDIAATFDLKVEAFSKDEIGYDEGKIILTVPVADLIDHIAGADPADVQSLALSLIDVIEDTGIDLGQLNGALAAALKELGDEDCCAVFTHMFSKLDGATQGEIAALLGDELTNEKMGELAARVVGLIKSDDLNEDDVENARSFLEGMGFSTESGGEPIGIAALIIGIIGSAAAMGIGFYFYRDTNQKINWLRKRMKGKDKEED